MSKEAALVLLARLKASLETSRPFAEEKGLEDYYKRDAQFIGEAQLALSTGERQKVQWVLDQMRNLSQGFGSYCSDLKALDSMLDRLFVELEDALSR